MSVVRVLGSCGSIVLVIAVALVAVFSSGPALAFWPPLQGVQEWVEMDGYTRSVRFTVYDPSRSTSCEGSVDFPGTSGHYYNIFNVAARGGIVTWWAYEMTAGVNTAREVWYAVYDPAAGEWRSDHRRCEQNAMLQWELSSPLVDTGVVAWTAQKVVHYGSMGDHEVCYATYDPAAGEWRFSSRIFAMDAGVYWETSQMCMGDGILAWQAHKRTGPYSTSDTRFCYVIYDPVRAAWMPGESTGYTYGLRVSDQAVRFPGPTRELVRGYDSTVGAWYDGPTKPVARFYASPTQAISPRPVWFMDMSIGATSWSLGFGDGAQTAERGAWHPYSWGVHTAAYAVTGPAGTASESCVIRIGLDRAYVNRFAPGPVHDGSSWETAFLGVQEGITAVLPGGEVWVRGTKYWERIALKPDTALYGGFVGTETAKEQRDWRTYPAILLAPSDPSQGTMVTVPQGAKATTILDGFHISGGRACKGGGILCEQASPIIRNCTVSACVSTSCGCGDGGGSGGGIYLSSGVPLVENCTIRGNVALNGGGLFIAGSTATVRGCTIEDNRAAQGGGVYIDSAVCTVTGSTITANVADSSGGGVHCQNSPNAVIDHNWIIRNTSHGNGGGAAVVSGATRMPNNVLAENTADGAVPAGQGGAIYCQAASPVITNNTIVRNTAAEGGGIACRNTSKPSVLNSIVAFGSSGQYTDATSVPYHIKNCFYGNTAYDYQGDQPGPGNIHLDPMMVNAAGGDYHLVANSPCFNKGDSNLGSLPATDIDGEARILYGLVDIGADEYGGPGGSIWEGKLAPNTESVCVGPGVVTHVYSSSWFWMESEDRTSAIGVSKAAHGVSVGMRVSVVGIMRQTSAGERYISATFIMPSGTGGIEPYLLTNDALGGGPFFHNSVTGAGQCGVKDGVGANNIGLLVRTTGRVTFASSGSFYVDDGSGESDGSGHAGVQVGLVTGIGAPPVGNYVSVTGTSTIVLVGTRGCRIIRPRNQADIVVLE